MPLSFPKYITKVEATFTNTGGELSAPLESDIRIIVPSDAIPAGISQDIFFGVFSEETILLRDVPEAPDKTLISPLVECGPHDIHLSKPVEIIVPHCLCLSDAKMEWITVYRCGHFPAQGTWLFYALMLVLGEKKNTCSISGPASIAFGPRPRAPGVKIALNFKNLLQSTISLSKWSPQ